MGRDRIDNLFIIDRTHFDAGCFAYYKDKDDYDIDKDVISDPDEESGDWDHDGNEDQRDNTFFKFFSGSKPLVL